MENVLNASTWETQIGYKMVCAVAIFKSVSIFTDCKRL